MACETLDTMGHAMSWNESSIVFGVHVSFILQPATMMMMLMSKSYEVSMVMLEFELFISLEQHRETNFNLYQKQLFKKLMDILKNL